MAQTAVSRVFLDTNVLVYASVAGAPFHAEALQAIQSREQAGIELWISRQVIREYLAVLTRPQTFSQPMPTAALVSQIQAFESRFQVADDTAEVTAHLLTLMKTVPIGGAQVHDANIVAMMQVYNVNELLTHNISDFARFTHLVTVTPLVRQATP